MAIFTTLVTATKLLVKKMIKKTTVVIDKKNMRQELIF